MHAFLHTKQFIVTIRTTWTVRAYFTWQRHYNITNGQLLVLVKDVLVWRH